MIQDEFRDWHMRIVGPDNSGYLPELQAQVREQHVQRVSFAGPAFGDAKRRLFEDAQLFVLPTHSENFGISVAEALAHGVPSIVSRGAPWSGLESEQCGRWVDNDPHVLANSLREMMALAPSELRTMGHRGRAWMMRDYSWRQCTRMMMETYRWLREGGPPCSWILRTSSAT
jgi:glycosyltransferase involved in cell wall biosynthesis